jgi:hypothetical protein
MRISLPVMKPPSGPIKIAPTYRECRRDPQDRVANTVAREEFKRKVNRYLTGKYTEAREILYFKAYKNQSSMP